VRSEHHGHDAGGLERSAGHRFERNAIRDRAEAIATTTIDDSLGCDRDARARHAGL
jgi:hypothetical protein